MKVRTGWVIGLALLVAKAAFAESQTTPSESGASTLELAVDGALILGDHDAIEVTIRAPETPATADRPLRLSVNVGAFGPVQRTAAGIYRASYTLPSTRFPQVALIAVWRETGPEAPVDFHRIPLSARTELPVKAKAGALVTVQVGETQFGPLEVSKSGEVNVPIVVPPGVDRALVQSERGAKRAQAWVPARVPPYNHLTLALTPHRIPADGVSYVKLHAYYDGAPPPLERFRITAGPGKIEPMGLEGQRAIFRFTPDRGVEEREVPVAAAIDREPASKAEAKLTLGLPIPERAVARPLEAPWQHGQPTALTVLVTDRYGLGVPRLTATATLSEGRVLGVEDRGDGVYAFTLASPKEPSPSVHFSARFARGQTTLEMQADLQIEVPAGLKRTPPPPPPPPPAPPFGPFVAGFLSGGYGAQLLPGAGLELGYRPSFADARLGFFLRASYLRRSGQFRTPESSGADVDAVTHALPILLGARLDWLRDGAFKAYVDGAGGLVFAAHRLEVTIDGQARDPLSVNVLGAGAELGLGACYHGVFLELAAAAHQATADDVDRPRVRVPLLLGVLRMGYRWEAN